MKENSKFNERIILRLAGVNAAVVLSAVKVIMSMNNYLRFNINFKTMMGALPYIVLHNAAL